MSNFTDEALEEVAALKQEGMTNDQIGHRIGMSEAAVRRRLGEAVNRGILGVGGALAPVPEGRTLGKITRLVTRADGVGMQWEHIHPGAQNLEAIFDLIETTMRDAVQPRLPLVGPVYTEDGLSVYPDADMHLGMYAWKAESGENYDLDIAEQILKDTFTKLFERMPPTRDALILDLGDGMHADNNSAQTERSGAHLDVDSRFDKVLHKAIELALWKVELALQKHTHVFYKRMRGNHDPYAARAVEAALYFGFRNDPRVTVDRTPGSFYMLKHGRNMIAAHHGHEVAPSDMPTVMSNYWPEVWGSTENRYAYLGHFHRKRKGNAMQDEQGGAVWEIFETIAPKDAWNRSMGHSAGRSLTGIVLDPYEGETVRHTVKARNK